MSPNLFLTLGIIGMVCILVAFLMVQMHRWTQDQFKYDALNLLGSALLVAYALDGRTAVRYPERCLGSIFAPGCRQGSPEGVIHTLYVYHVYIIHILYIYCTHGTAPAKGRSVG